MGSLVQSTFGAAGNFEVVLPRAQGGGAAHWWRDNDHPTLPWHGPSMPFGCAGDLGGLALVQSTFGPGNLEVVATEGHHLCHTARVLHNGAWTWLTPSSLPGSVVAGSAPGLIQGPHGLPRNFEVVAPLAGGGLGHWWRDNSHPAFPWNGPAPFAGAAGQFEAATLVHGHHSGHLEVVARTGGELQHWWRDGSGVWHQSASVAAGVVGHHDLTQSLFMFGAAANYEVVAPLAGGGMGHWWANPTAPALTWSGPTVFGSGDVRSVGLIQSRHGNLEVVARFDDHLEHWWRESTPPFDWHGPHTFWSVADADAAIYGRNDVLFDTGTVAIHAVVLRTGEVLVWSYHDHDASVSQSHLIDPVTAQTRQVPNVPHAFCSGLAAAPDGAVVVTGGHHLDLGEVHVFNPDQGLWSHVADMAAGRWYPTQTCLPDGRITTMSGSRGGGPVGPQNPANNTVEFFHRSQGLSVPTDLPSPWSHAFPPSMPTIDLYPFVYVLPEGDLSVHSRHVTRRYDWQTNQWGPEIHGVSSVSRTYPGQGSSVLLALDPPDYAARVLVMGGGGANPESITHHTPAVATAEILDFSQPDPAWRSTASMAHARVMPDAVLLPDGTVVVCGGSASGRSDAGAEPVFPIERFNPADETWSTMASIAVPRLYHSTALLLPDARVFMGGKDGIYQPDGFKYPEHRGEVFSPPYLFAGPRPVITGGPSHAAYGATFSVSTPDGHRVDTARIARPGAVTHSFNHEQRLVGLVIDGATDDALTLVAPPNANLAPPGWYLLFLLAGGVPSVGHFIQFT